jgi:hypothetical protein
VNLILACHCAQEILRGRRIDKSTRLHPSKEEARKEKTREKKKHEVHGTWQMQEETKEKYLQISRLASVWCDVAVG